MLRLFMPSQNDDRGSWVDFNRSLSHLCRHNTYKVLNNQAQLNIGRWIDMRIMSNSGPIYINKYNFGRAVVYASVAAGSRGSANEDDEAAVAHLWHQDLERCGVSARAV